MKRLRSKALLALLFEQYGHLLQPFCDLYVLAVAHARALSDAFPSSAVRLVLRVGRRLVIHHRTLWLCRRIAVLVTGAAVMRAVGHVMRLGLVRRSRYAGARDKRETRCDNELECHPARLLSCAFPSTPRSGTRSSGRALTAIKGAEDLHARQAAYLSGRFG
jgi:hypothetical protein